jgi:hypothetical protein
MSTQYLLAIPDAHFDQAWNDFTIDYVLALYLIDVADLSRNYQQSAQYYRCVASLVQMLRECLKETFKMMFGAEVTTANKGPHSIPLVVNDFLGSFLPLKCNLFDQEMSMKQI